MNGIAGAFTDRLPVDAELKYTSAGKALLNFSGAVDVNRANDAAEPPPTEWVRVTCWEETAERLASVLAKGAQVYVEGRLRLNEYESGGEHRAGLTVSAWNVEPLGAIGKRAPKRPERERRESQGVAG